MSGTPFLVSLIVPCHNEEANISELYNQIVQNIPDLRYEIIFVDDKSTDKTLEELKILTQKDPSVNYLSFTRNFGHQNALRAGLEKAKGDCVISLDADLQHPPELIPQMVEQWKNGYDVVITVRDDREVTNLFKRFTGYLFYSLVNLLTAIEIPRGAADFRLLDARVVHMLTNNFQEYHLFYRGLISWMGFKQTKLTYKPNKRYSGKSNYSFSKMLALAINGVTSFSVKPLKFATYLGFSLFICSLLYSAYILWAYFFIGELVQGWTSILLSVLIIGGINMMLLGIIGEYIARIFIQVKNRPFYLIQESSWDKE